MTRTLTLTSGDRTMDIPVTNVRYGPAPTSRASLMEAIEGTIEAIWNAPPLQPDTVPMSRAQWELMDRLNTRLKQGTQ